MEVQLHFYNTLSGLKGDEFAFIQPTYISVLPKEGDYFDYTEELYDRMTTKEKAQFDQRKFSVANYYVAGVKDWRQADNDIDYTIFLIKNHVK